MAMAKVKNMRNTFHITMYFIVLLLHTVPKLTLFNVIMNSQRMTLSHSSFPLYFNQFFWRPAILQSLHVLSHQVPQVNIKITKGHFMRTKSWHCQFLSVHFHDQYIVKKHLFPTNVSQNLCQTVS